jgi:tripartite ATP-independent transporter DctM subunit
MSVPAVIIGGILFGIFTPTESAGIAAIIVILLGLIYRKLTWRAFYRSVVETGVVTGTVLFVVGVSAILGWSLISENAGDLIANGLKKITNDPTVTMILIVGALFLLGCIMEVLAVLILTIPVLFPVVQALGVDPVYFGVIATIALASGLVTPPFGLTMFLMSDMAGVSIEQFSREAAPFLLCLLFGLILFVLVPDLILWLPNKLMAGR